MVRLILIIAITISYTQSFPQLTYEGKFDTNLKSIQLENGSVKYLNFDSKIEKLLILNIDHSLWKEIDLTIPEGHYLDEIKLISQRIFDKDDQYEVLYTCYKFENSPGLESPEEMNSKYLFTMMIVNESGKELLNIKNAMDYKILQVNRINKLLIFVSDKGGFSTNNFTEVYSIN